MRVENSNKAQGSLSRVCHLVSRQQRDIFFLESKCNRHRALLRWDCAGDLMQTVNGPNPPRLTHATH